VSLGINCFHNQGISGIISANVTGSPETIVTV